MVLQNEKKNCNIKSIRNYHGGEFQNERFNRLCEKYGITHSFYAPRTLQQNDVVERNNRSLEVLAMTMLNEYDLPKYFWVEIVYIVVYVLNRTLIRHVLKKTSYELYKGRKPNISHLRVFGCKCFIMNNGKDNLGKSNAKSDEGILIGYALNGHAYRIYNRRLLTVEVSVHVLFYETNNYLLKPVTDELESSDLRIALQKNQLIDSEITDSIPAKEHAINLELPREWRTLRDFTIGNVIGNIEKGVSSINSLNNFSEAMAFVSQV